MRGKWHDANNRKTKLYMLKKDSDIRKFWVFCNIVLLAGKLLVKVKLQFFRLAEVEMLLGNPAKAEKELEWRLQVGFTELVERMVNNNLEIVEKELKAGLRRKKDEEKSGRGKNL
ncbi:MAG: GDP-mannose 4,6-dehydratase [Eubacterium sp.]|nr:GDP-mannose 4,6-dehydratase [Eubacterium sp.]